MFICAFSQLWKYRIQALGGPLCHANQKNKKTSDNAILQLLESHLMSAPNQDGTVHVWELRANKRAQTMKPLDGVQESMQLGESAAAIRSISMSSDASLMVAGNNAGCIFCWRPRGSSITTGPCYPQQGGFVMPSKGTNDAGESGNGRRGAYRTLGVTRTAHSGYLLKCVISPDVNRLVTCSADKTVKVWNINKERLDAYLHHDEPSSETATPKDQLNGAADVRALASSNDMVSAGANSSLSSSAPPSTPPPPLPPSLLSHTSPPPVPFPRVQHVSGHDTRPGSMASGITLERNLAQHQRWVWDACFSADSAYLVTASSDQTAKLWDVQTGEVIRHYTSQMAITCVALNDASS